MAKGDYPTGALVEVLREYKADGGASEVYAKAKKELKNVMMAAIKAEELETSIDRLHMKLSVASRFCTIRKCKSCEGYYADGYLCDCGEDNS